MLVLELYRVLLAWSHQHLNLHLQGEARDVGGGSDDEVSQLRWETLSIQCCPARDIIDLHPFDSPHSYRPLLPT